jgi:hypothetical protein
MDVVKDSDAEKVVTGTPIQSEVSIALVEFLVYGIEEDKAKIHRLFTKIQEQMAKVKKGNLCRILWYVDKGELTDVEKKQWLENNSKSKYHIFVPTTYLVKPDYVKNTLMQIKALEYAIDNAKGFGIVPTKKQKVEPLKAE